MTAHDHEPTDDGTACRHCGLTAEPGTISPDALALLAAYAIADHDGTRARVGTIRADAARRHAISAQRLTDDALATAAALAGIVADRDALPLNTARPAAWRAVDAGRVPGDTRQPANNLGAYARLAEAIARQREAGDVWAGAIAARADKTTHEQRLYESSDAFEERQQTSSHYRRTSWPIIRAADWTDPKD